MNDLNSNKINNNDLKFIIKNLLNGEPDYSNLSCNMEAFKKFHNYFKSKYESYKRYIDAKLNNKRFRKHLYKKYIEKYFNIDAVYCRKHIVRHIDLNTFMESFQAGFKEFVMSSEWKTFLENASNHFDIKLDKCDQINMTFSIDVTQIVKGVNVTDYYVKSIVGKGYKGYKICFYYAMIDFYKECIAKFVEERKKYKSMNIVLTDVELYFINNIRNTFNLNSYLTDLCAKINIYHESIKPMVFLDETVNINLHNFIKSSYEFFKYMSNTNPLTIEVGSILNVNYVSEIKTVNDLTDEIMIKFETLVKIFNEYCDTIHSQCSNVLKYNINDSINDFYNSPNNICLDYSNVECYF